MIPKSAPSNALIAAPRPNLMAWAGFLLLALCLTAGLLFAISRSTHRPDEMDAMIKRMTPLEKRSENPALVDPVGKSAKDHQDFLEETLMRVDGVRSATVSIRTPQDGFTPPVRAAITLEMKPGARLTSTQRSDIVHMVECDVMDLKREDVALYVHEHPR